MASSISSAMTFSCSSSSFMTMLRFIVDHPDSALEAAHLAKYIKIAVSLKDKVRRVHVTVAMQAVLEPL